VWKGYNWNVELDIAKAESENAVVWQCTQSNMQNTNAREGSTVTIKFYPDRLARGLNLNRPDTLTRRVTTPALLVGTIFWVEA
jgi:hypothetical protein